MFNAQPTGTVISMGERERERESWFQCSNNMLNVSLGQICLETSIYSHTVMEGVD